ncbi:glycosyltransferase family 4 protein [Nocardia uniformis]|uniref:Glycosyltransferase family 4 protein n=1 Tax=Nocardia uniformis TaxID=53432 RepID=A0A849CB20_9NOCA|nr:glycosyltransferase family 4 protein [Nocardia uniformis]NNH76043.1 glycosyltransferase family 4 protein [Nocardia uniformis]
MRICLITTTYRPRTGGLETYIITMAEAFAHRGHNVTVLTNRDSVDQPIDSIDNGVRVLRTSALLSPPKAGSVPWESALFGVVGDVVELLGGNQFDVIHTHTQAALLLAAMAGLGSRAPLIASLHETQPECEPAGENRARFILSGADPDLMIAGSNAFAEQAVHFGYPPDRLRVIYHGLSASSSTAADRRRLRRVARIPDDGLLVSLVGRFKPRKGQHRLLDAYEHMAQREKVWLLLAGSCNSADSDYLKRIRQDIDDRGLSDRVTVLVDCPDTVRDSVWAATDIATQPSTVEGLGLACIEAMHAGVPVVATNTRGLREVVTQATGILTDTADPANYAEALDALAADAVHRRSLGSAGRTRAQTVFSLDRAVSKTLSVYTEAIDKEGYGIKLVTAPQAGAHP